MSVPAWLVLRQEAQGDPEVGNGSVQSLQLLWVNTPRVMGTGVCRARVGCGARGKDRDGTGSHPGEAR